MKKDIKTRRDIELLIDKFFEKIKGDELIGHYFIEVANVNWDEFLPRISDFWENTLLLTGSYTGNPMMIHKRIHSSFPLEEKHFQRWVTLFNSTVDELFEGEKGLLAKQKVISISSIMKGKILNEKARTQRANNEN